MKIALITGAGQGLGQGFVQILSSKGYFVYAGVRKLTQFTKDTNLIKYVQLDVEDDQSIQNAINLIHGEQSTLDLLINNAGVNKNTATNGHPESATTLSVLNRTVLQSMFNVNAIGPLMVTKYAVSLMTLPNSFIINISSDRASFHDDTNRSGNYGYRASKVALNMLTQCSLIDLPVNVSTFAVHPGWVRTKMNPTGILKPTESAELIMGITENWDPKLNGNFLNNDGSSHQI